MSEETAAVETEVQPGVETFETAESKEVGARKLTTTYAFGKDLDEMVEKHGAEVIYGMAIKALKVAMQANIRGRLAAVKEGTTELKYTDEEINQWIQSDYKPGVRAARTGGGAEKGVASLVAKMKKSGITMEQLLAMVQAAQADKPAAE